jgi:hypothetical protein
MRKMRATNRETGRDHDTGDFSDLLTGLRILLPSAQLLTAFLLTLPFNHDFANVMQSQKWVFLATFLCSLASVVLLGAPAIQHRLMRPLRDRVRFKEIASREVLAGSLALSSALILGTHLVTSQVFGHPTASIAAAFVAAMIVALWWLFPMVLRSIAT